MAKRAGMICVTAHFCRFGMSGRDHRGAGLVLKPTKFLTDCPAIAAELDRQCVGGHRHISSLNAGGLTQFSIYPPALCHAISRGLARQRKTDTRIIQVPRDDFPLMALCEEDAQDTEELVGLAVEELSDGESEEEFVAFDDAKGGILLLPLVREAQKVEMQFVKDCDI